MARDTLSIAGIAAHTAPKGLSGFLKWLAHRRKNRKEGMPRKELTYAEGVDIVKAFLEYAATHGVGELQRFTASKVPRCVVVPVSGEGATKANPRLPVAQRGSSKRRSPSPRSRSTKPRTSCERQSLRIRERWNSSAARRGGRCAAGSFQANGSR